MSSSEATSIRVSVLVENTTPFALTKWKEWGDSWTTGPADAIPARTKVEITSTSNNRLGCVYLATDTDGNQVGYATLSFTCPKSSHNSAEGSPHVEGTFISAGLQQYKRTGTPASFHYMIGAANRACWDDGDKDNGSLECDQSTLNTWAKVVVAVKNTHRFDLHFVRAWPLFEWVEGKGPVSLTKGAQRIFMFNSSDKCGLYFKAMDGPREVGYATMSMAQKHHAEGSPTTTDVFVPAGLQPYANAPSNTGAYFYRVNEANKASWDDARKDSGKVECAQTLLDGRAKVIVRNNNAYELTFAGDWSDEEDRLERRWYFRPDGNIPSQSHKLLVLATNARSGVFYSADATKYHLSFTCPKSSSNSAEGSPASGLQVYEPKGVPVTFTYEIGTPNLSSWNNPQAPDDAHPTCPQTQVPSYPTEDLAIAKLNVDMSQIANTDPRDARSKLANASFELLDVFDSKDTGTSGFLAYSTSKETAVLAFRDIPVDTAERYDAMQTESPLGGDFDKEAMVVTGLAESYKSVKAAVERAVSNLSRRVGDLSTLYVTGHGLGGALAPIAGLYLCTELSVRPTVVTFGAPPCGNDAFLNAFRLREKKAKMRKSFAYELPNDEESNGHWARMVAGTVFAFDFEQWGYVQPCNVCVLTTGTYSFPESNKLNNYAATIDKLLV